MKLNWKSGLSKVVMASSSITVISLIAVPAQAANLLQNGSFENTNGTFVNNGLGAMSLPTGSTTIPGWTTINQELGWLNNNNIYGPVITPFGDYFLDLTGYHDSFPYGGVTQTISTTVGSTYKLSLNLGVNNPFYPGPISVRATAGSTSQTFTFNSSETGNQWGQFNLDFTASSTSTPISIVGISSASGVYLGGFYLGLDNVSVEEQNVAIPEPLTILGTVTALSFGTFFRGKLSKKQNKGSNKA
ncbi:PEP-CTERM sorting domain-containing protein [Gloeothece verrucosa]|uniref:DUF642 domain-containing protein n=1 Tax=Gloeothece verrucosa (strain PCC 7822) TaxID=497965 RepID=E0U7J8_GLOV7|nr:PEP-CTERM sorting domain-containing protein [Gloeothece verrucosa]ADN13694.1 conserved hypothetical protein [Gloeothece verrucosa PCC 7822]